MFQIIVVLVVAFAFLAIGQCWQVLRSGIANRSTKHDSTAVSLHKRHIRNFLLAVLALVCVIELGYDLKGRPPHDGWFWWHCAFVGLFVGSFAASAAIRGHRFPRLHRLFGRTTLLSFVVLAIYYTPIMWKRFW